MQVKVQYEATVIKNATVNIDEDEFLEYVNMNADEDDAYGSIQEYQADAGERFNDDLKEFLEDGEDSFWQVGDIDHMAEEYDQNILEVKLS